MLELWHGGNRWEGDPEIRPPKQGRYECGPGIYLTTSYQRARKYAKGGKIVTRVTLANNVRWLDDAKLPLGTLEAYVRETRGMRMREQILADLQRCAQRESAEALPVDRLLNLCINYDAIAGQQGVHLASWLAEQGIDASLHRPHAGEDWVIVFNPKVIIRHRVVPGVTIHGDADLPLVQAQLAQQ